MNRFAAVFDCPCGPPWRLLAVLAACLLGPVTLRADEITVEDGARFDVRSAFLESAERVYQLRATLDLALSRSAQQAIREGVPVVLELDIRVDRRRRFLPDEEVAFLVQRWQIHYHALSERYLVNNLNSGQQASFLNLASALAALSDVRDLPVIDEALIEPGQRYEASLKAIATIEGGLPNALRVMMFWIDWKRSTDWYTWTVRP
ncbi:MAG TPA: DUF4390 domain-containing protein [Steroidobacteraceae bacterium]|nr:DUF4390 domain-containing protein [Steroidobacteraceae bacterium]